MTHSCLLCSLPARVVVRSLTDPQPGVTRRTRATLPLCLVCADVVTLTARPDIEGLDISGDNGADLEGDRLDDDGSLDV